MAYELFGFNIWALRFALIVSAQNSALENVIYIFRKCGFGTKNSD